MLPVLLGDVELARPNSKAMSSATGQQGGAGAGGNLKAQSNTEKLGHVHLANDKSQ